jgi:hypothetical protein
MKKNIKISKLDASKRQLECAISIYFNDGEPVSIHTLSAAAYNILRALNGEKVWMSKDRITDYVKKGREKDARDALNKIENFFKHADRDPDNILDFNPEANEFMIWEACIVYKELTGEYPDKMKIYNIWFKNKYNHLFISMDEQKQMAERIKAVMQNISKQEFYRLALLSLNQINT